MIGLLQGVVFFTIRTPALALGQSTTQFTLATYWLGSVHAHYLPNGTRTATDDLSVRSAAVSSSGGGGGSSTLSLVIPTPTLAPKGGNQSNPPPPPSPH